MVTIRTREEEVVHREAAEIRTIHIGIQEVVQVVVTIEGSTTAAVRHLHITVVAVLPTLHPMDEEPHLLHQELQDLDKVPHHTHHPIDKGGLANLIPMDTQEELRRLVPRTKIRLSATRMIPMQNPPRL